MSFAAAQKHVAVLERAGLIQKRANGREQLVSTNRARLQRAGELLDSFAAILGRSTPAAKMLATRARARIRLGTPATAADAAAREVVEAFLAAAGRGDMAGLLAVLAPEAELRGNGPQGPFVVRGAEQIARNARVGARPGVLRPAVVDGLPGLLVIVDGQPVTVLAFTVANGAVTAIRALTDPDRLAQIVPSWVA